MVSKFFSFAIIFSLTLSSFAYAMDEGAGVSLLYEENGIAVISYGKEPRRSPGGGVVHKWSPYGGKVDPQDKGNYAKAAKRELYEETGYKVDLPEQIIANSPYVDHNHPTGGFYRDFYVDMRAHPIPHLTPNPKNKHQEKVEYRFANIEDLLQSVNSGSKLFPGTNEEIFGLTLAMLKKPATQTILNNFVNSVKQSPKPQPVPQPAPQKQSKRQKTTKPKTTRSQKKTVASKRSSQIKKATRRPKQNVSRSNKKTRVQTRKAPVQSKKQTVRQKQTRQVKRYTPKQRTVTQRRKGR